MSEPTTVTKTAPERIWLQHSDDMLDVDLPFPEEHGGISWCHEQVFMGDVEYTRSDLCATLTGAGMSECKCNLREKLVGDGCEVCNPAKSLEYAKETIEELTQQRDMLLEALRHYGRHRVMGEMCAFLVHGDNPCTCGLDAAIATVEGWGDEQREEAE